MKVIVERGIGALKDVITYRCAGLPPAGLAAVLGEADEFAALILHECSRQDHELTRAREENELLRKLVGTGESGMAPHLLKQGEELHALRVQISELRSALEQANSRYDTARDREAAAEHTCASLRKLKDEDARQFAKELVSLREQLHSFQSAVRTQLSGKEGTYEI